MPILVYRCNVCGKDFETLILDKFEKVSCPLCHSDDLEKQPTTFSSLSTSSKKDDIPTPPPCSSCCPNSNLCNL